MHVAVRARVVVVHKQARTFRDQRLDKIHQAHRDVAGLVADAYHFAHPMPDVWIHSAHAVAHDLCPRRSHVVQLEMLHFVFEKAGIEPQMV